MSSTSFSSSSPPPAHSSTVAPNMGGAPGNPLQGFVNGFQNNAITQATDGAIVATQNAYTTAANKVKEYTKDFGFDADPLSPFSKVIDPDAAAEILDVEANPYQPNSFYGSAKQRVRSYFYKTTFFTPSVSKDQNPSTFSEVIDAGSKIFSALAKPELLMSFSQANDVRVLSPTWLQNQNNPGKGTAKINAQSILPSASGKPITTLAELLEILGKLVPRSLDPALNPTVIAGGTTAIPDDVNGTGDSKAKPNTPKISADAATTLTVNEGFNKIGWFQSFFGKSAALDGVLADSANAGDSEWGWSSLGKNLAKAGDAFRNNMMANAKRDSDVQYLVEQSQRIRKDLPEALTKTIRSMEKGAPSDNTTIEPDAATLKAEEEALKIKNEQARVRSSRNLALKYLGCFCHDGKDIADRQPIRYCALSSFFVNALALRIGASAGKSLHNQREAAKQEFLDQKFKPLEEFDFYRRHMVHLTTFDQTFDNGAGFMKEWDTYLKRTTKELTDKQEAIATAKHDLQQQQVRIERNIVEKEDQIVQQTDVLRITDNCLKQLSGESGGNSKNRLIGSDERKRIENGIKIRVAETKSDRENLLNRIKMFKGDKETLLGAKKETINKIKDLDQQTKNTIQQQADLEKVYDDVEQKILLNYTKMHDALEEAKLEVRDFATKNNGLDISPCFIDGRQPTLDELLALAKVDPRKYANIQKKLNEANHYYRQTLIESSFDGEFDIANKLELPPDDHSFVEKFKTIVKKRACDVSCEDYSYENEEPRFNRYLTPELRKDARIARLDLIQREIAGGSTRETGDRLEADWILPMLKASDFKHGFLKSLMWRSTVVLGGIALMAGVVKLVSWMAIGRFFQVLRYKIIRGGYDLVVNLGAWPQWRNSLADVAQGLIELATLPFYIVGSLASEIYNETQLLHDRVSQVVYPFLRY